MCLTPEDQRDAGGGVDSMNDGVSQLVIDRLGRRVAGVRFRREVQVERLLGAPDFLDDVTDRRIDHSFAGEHL